MVLFVFNFDSDIRCVHTDFDKFIYGWLTAQSSRMQFHPRLKQFAFGHPCKRGSFVGKLATLIPTDAYGSTRWMRNSHTRVASVFTSTAGTAYGEGFDVAIG